MMHPGQYIRARSDRLGSRSAGTILGAISFVILLGSATLVEAASPSISSIRPQGAQRGSEIEVTFNGANLDDARDLMFYEPGIELAKLEVVNDKSVKATLKIAPDCQLGSHRLRLRTATGITDLRVFLVGALPIIEEVEPNSDFKSPQPVEMNTTVAGVVQNEDVDYFVVEAKKGERITAEIEAIRMGLTLFDAYVAILNEARFELSAADDTALVYQDGVASIIAPEDGRYIIQVRDSSYGGNGASLYHLHIGNFPRPLATVPGGGKAGEQVSVDFIGDVGGKLTQTVTLPATPGEIRIFAQDEKGISPTGNPFRVTNLDNFVEQEPNENHDTATVFTAPGAVNGVISSPDDQDYFRFSAKRGEPLDIRVYARHLRSPLDSVLTVFVPGRGAIASNDDAAGSPDSALRFNPPADRDYILHIRDHLNKGGTEYAYRIELTPAAPELKLSVAEFVQYVQPTVSVPKGNRFALMLNAQRLNFGGPLTLRAEDLPKGVTVETPGAIASLNSIPILFTAAPDADVAGALAVITGMLDDPEKKQTVEGRLRQEVMLVRGQNNTPFWTETVDRLAVAVTEEAPFSIEVVEPKVPVVQNGSMNLKVVATRKEGFTAPIKVDLLWFPPGINASRSVSIAEGQTEALISVNAAGNAAPGEWKVAVTGQAPVGNGPVMVASPFFTLRVSEPYVTLAYDLATVEQGQETEVVVKVETQKEFEGAAQVKLLGLPNKATTEDLELTKDTTELVFKVKTQPDSPAGTHKSLLCQVVVMENGEPITHNLGTGQLRIDPPPPPKKDAPAAAPAPVAQKPADQPPMKRLSRLEQLRLEQEEREKAKAAAANGAGQ